MKSYSPQWYASPIALPEGRSGKLEVRHRIIPAGTELDIIGLREAYMRGLPPARSAPLPEPLRVHELHERGVGIWMTDLPIELNQMYEIAETLQPAGNVLLGGLGLGVMATILSHVVPTIIERSKDVIKLCKSPLQNVVLGDVHDFVCTEKRSFDFYLLDTWQTTNEQAWWEQVVPLRRAIRQRHGLRPVIHCWAEEMMVSQIFDSLTRCSPHWWTKHLHVPMTARTAKTFIRTVGTIPWEQKYGARIDQAAADLKALDNLPEAAAHSHSAPSAQDTT